MCHSFVAKAGGSACVTSAIIQYGAHGVKVAISAGRWRRRRDKRSINK